MPSQLPRAFDCHPRRGQTPARAALLALTFAAWLCAPQPAAAQGAMTNGQNHAGTIATAGEVDEWTFAAAAGDAITMSVSEPGADSAFVPWIRLVGPNGALVAQDWGALVGLFTVAAPESGQYRVLVASNDTGRNDTGAYVVRLARTPAAFVVPADDEGGAITNGANHQGAIPRGDLDLWTFTAAVGDVVTVSVAEVGADAAFVPYVALRAPNGALVAHDWGALVGMVTATAPQAGVYTVVVFSNDTNHDATGAYQLTIAHTPASFVVPGDDEGGEITNGRNHPGVIHRGDLDQWTFTAAAGDVITVALGEVGTDSPFVPYVALRGPNGALLAHDWGALAAMVTVTAAQAGRYTVLVRSNDTNSDATGAYQLTIARTPGSFVVPTDDQGGAMTNGANHQGVIHRADLDQWTFAAAAGDTITLALGEIGADSAFVPYLALRGPNGALLAHDWGALAALVTVTAPQAGVYTVLVLSNDTSNDAAGAYQLTLARTPATFVVPTGDEGGAMTNGANHQGVIHRADLDQWTFTAAAGDAISVSIGELGADSPFVPYLALRGPNGALLGHDWGALAARVTVTAPLAGVYTVVVLSNDTNNDDSGAYRLTLAQTPGAFVVPTGDEGGPMTNGTDHTGVIHRADLDQWTFSAVQGARITLSIAETGGDSPFVPYIALRGPNGALVAHSWGATSAQLTVTAPANGRYGVIAASNDTGGDAEGAYVLRVLGASTGANLGITKTFTLGPSQQNRRLTYELTITNAGPEPATSVVVTDVLPAQVAFVSCTAAGGSCSIAGRTVTASIPELASGATAAITIATTVTVSPPATIVNTATVASAVGDPAMANNTATTTLVLQPASPDDTDDDGLMNDWETRFGLDANSSDGDNGAGGDPDGDGLNNTQEQAGGTHPRGFFRRFLAEGALNAFFDVRLAILNVGAQDAILLRRYLQPGGATVTQYEVLPPGRRRTLTEADLASLSSPDFSTVVESDQPLVVDRTMSWGGGYGSHAEGGVPSAATTWYLAEGSTSGDFSLFYLIQNPNPTATTATVRYLLPFGQSPIVREYSLAPNSRTTIPVDEQGEVLAGTDVSGVISAPVPIIVERAMYRSTAAQPFAAGHGSAGVTAPATSWFLAEGATGPFFDCFILLANPNDAAAAVTVNYLLSTGATHTQTYTVPANGRFTIWADNEEIPSASGMRPLENVAVSSTVTSTLPIIVERTMWWPGPGLAADFWTEAHNSPGATATGTMWALAEGEVGGGDATETYILLANTSATAGVARVTLYFEDGTSAQQEFPLLPLSRRNVNVSADFAPLVDFTAPGRQRFGAVIESIGAAPAQIVVERAMYTSPGGQTWAAGTNALAARIR